MIEKAVISKSYRIQLGVMGLFIAFWCAWFLYDGYVGYPHKRLIAQEFARYSQDPTLLRQWPEYAREKGWPDGTQGDPGYDHSDMDIFVQKLIGYGLLPITLMYLSAFVRSYGKWISMDENGFSTSWGRHVAFSSITDLNKSRWQTKGIAVARYDDNGKSRKLVLDSYHYTRDEITRMLKETQQRLDPGLISGDVPQPPPPQEDEQEQQIKA